MTEPKVQPAAPTRRDFLAAATAAGVLSAAAPAVHAAGSDIIKVGLIGCGGRGTGAAEQSVNSSSNVKLVALGDMFADNLGRCYENVQKLGDKVDVPESRRFVGFDAYKNVIDSGVDLVILATPPGFRPMHLKAAIDAGKHVFCEKPVAVDGPGIRSVMASAAAAKEKNLAVVAGTQRRHQAGYLAMMEQIHGGLIGDVVAARAYWNQGSLWSNPRQPKWTDMEWQLRNWLYFPWLSGDHITEQHVHNIDVVNWAMQAHPTSAVTLGGRQVRTDRAYGNVFDHFAVDYSYPNGAHSLSMARQIDGCQNNVSEAIVGTKGSFDTTGGRYTHKGTGSFRFRQKERNPYEQEHIDLVESIRAGKPLNELVTVAESTLTAIMGRMSAYTGKEVTWEEALNSKEILMPAKLEFGELAVAPVPVPGKTPLV